MKFLVVPVPPSWDGLVRVPEMERYDLPTHTLFSLVATYHHGHDKSTNWRRMHLRIQGFHPMVVNWQEGRCSIW